LKNDIETLLYYCRLAFDRRLIYGSGGNISVRSGEYFLITPTGYSLGALTENIISKIDMDGNLLGGEKPSKESGMHLACYKRRNDVNAIVHVHPTYAVAVSCLKDLDCGCVMPIYTAGYNARVGKLPIIKYAPPGSAELAAMTADIISRRNSVMLANHGIVTVGSDLHSAYGIAEEIEQNAHQYWLLGNNGRALPV
jgi:ribulose-5-phosphate 4-epimerase/fuculose-1-phosphate aldolase